MKDCFSVSILLSFYYDNCLKCFSYDTFCMCACVLLLTRLLLHFSLSTFQRTGGSWLFIGLLFSTLYWISYIGTEPSIYLRIFMHDKLISLSCKNIFNYPIGPLLIRCFSIYSAPHMCRSFSVSLYAAV